MADEPSVQQTEGDCQSELLGPKDYAGLTGCIALHFLITLVLLSGSPVEEIN